MKAVDTDGNGQISYNGQLCRPPLRAMHCRANACAIRIPNIRTRNRKGAPSSIQKHRLQRRWEDLEARVTRRSKPRWHGGAE